MCLKNTLNIIFLIHIYILLFKKKKEKTAPGAGRFGLNSRGRCLARDGIEDFGRRA